MTEDLVIIGAGGFGREVKWLVERINRDADSRTGEKRWNICGFADDGVPVQAELEGLPVLGGCEWLAEQKKPLAVVCAVGSAKSRRKIIKKIKENKNLYFPNLLDPSVLMSESVQMGGGNIICAGTILTVDICMGDFCILNLDCTIGHDVKLGDFVTLYPSVNLSGNVTVGQETELGTGSHVIQGIKIGEQTIIGAGTVVIRDLPGECTAVGNPARIIH